MVLYPFHFVFVFCFIVFVYLFGLFKRSFLFGAAEAKTRLRTKTDHDNRALWKDRKNILDLTSGGQTTDLCVWRTPYFGS